MASVLAPFVVNVEAGTIAVYIPDLEIELSLSVAVGGDETGEIELEIDLSLVVGESYDSIYRTQNLGLTLVVGSYDNLHNKYVVQPLGLTFTIGKGKPYNVIMVWEPWESPLFTGKNYTYIVHLALSGTDIEDALIVVRFEGSYVTEKMTNATGFIEFWAVVGSPGPHSWSLTIYENGDENAIIWKDLLYVEGDPGPGDDPPDGPGPGDDIFDLPTEPGALLGVLDYIPVMVVFGFFGFGGMLMMGRLGILFGAVGALFVMTAMGTLPRWMLFFAILIAILVVVFKLKGGGSNVTVNNGGNEA